MMIQLTQVLPVSLKMVNGKKVPIGGMYAKNKVPYTDGMQNFAIHMLDYPQIVVLDLDIRDHPLIEYIDKTYTHKTRKGWHCFFKNTFNITSKRQKQKDKFDLLAGNNWLFYDYDDPDVAQYTEYNTLPLVDMPNELYDLVKTTAADLGENSLDRFIVNPLIDILKADKSLWEPKHSYWKGGRHEDGTYDKSALAFSILKELLLYTDVPEHVSAVLKKIEPLGKDTRHATLDYLTKWSGEGSIGKAKREISESKAVSWRPLSDFRAVSLGGKTMYADIDNATIVGAPVVHLAKLKSVQIDALEMFVETYHKVQFRPDIKDRFSENLYNLFDGFVEPEEGKDHEMFLSYVLEVICGNDKEYNDYLIKYLAHMVQKPTSRPDVAIVLFGHEKGTGKDTFHNLVGRMMKGNGYKQLTEEVLMGRFNMPLESCLLGVAEELVFGGSHKEDSALKRVITRMKHSIERKGLEPYEVNNYIRLIITSNSSRPVKATPGERRYFILSPSANRKGNFAYWKMLHDTFNPKHLIHYLNAIDISDFNPRDMPDTDALKEVIDHNKDMITENIEAWWATVYNNDRIQTDVLYEELTEDKKYIRKKEFSTLLFRLCGRGHFKKAFNKDLQNHYKIVGHQEREQIDTDDGLEEVEI